MQTLREKGVAEGAIAKTMRDVGVIILGRAMEVIVAQLPEDERAHLSKCLPAEIETYFKERPQLLTVMTQEKFDAIHDGAWNEYFAAIAA